MMRRRFGLFLLGLFLLAACTKRAWTAPISELEHGLEVVVKQAYVQGDDTLEIKTTVVNKGEATVRIDRKYWALELPNGQTLRHEDSSNITIAPGGASDLNVSFEMADEGFKSLTSATLIVGGIFLGDDPSPYPAGEIPLSQGPTPAGPPSAAAAPSASTPAASASAPPALPSAGPSGATTSGAIPSPAPEPGPEGPTMLKPEPDE